MSEATQVRHYKIEFLVKAGDWDGVVKVFADELDIHEKRNSGDRQVREFFFVSVELPEEKLTNDFYNSVKKSKKMAIVTDELSHQNGRRVIDEVYRVETCLRRHLLHIPDLVENYFNLFSTSTSKNARSRASSREVISAADFDPITSLITFEDILKILEDDFSWLNHPPSASDLTLLIESSSDLEDLKKKIKSKKKSTTIWAVVSQYVLEKPLPWNDAREQLYTLKELRNTAAHFRTVQESDAVKAKSLASEVMKKISKQKVRSATEEIALAEFVKGLNENLTKITSMINNSLSPQVDAFIRAYNTNLIQSAKTAINSFDRALIKEALNARLRLLGYDTPDSTKDNNAND